MKRAPIRFQDRAPGSNEIETRQWSCDGDHPNANGRTYTNIRCPFCGTNTRAYLWSLAGGGKRCSNGTCKALFGSTGSAYQWASAVQVPA